MCDWMRGACENPATFPIKERINTELFIVRIAALDIVESRI